MYTEFVYFSADKTVFGLLRSEGFGLPAGVPVIAAAL